MFYHLLKPHMLQTMILSTCLRITSHTYVHMNTYFIPNFLVYFKEFGECTYGPFPKNCNDYYIPVHVHVHKRVCFPSDVVFLLFVLIIMKTRTLKTSEMAIFVSFALFIVFDFFWVEWDTKILIQIMYFTLKPLTYFFFQSTIFRIN